ncbi:Large-conductance mechanosensitive channel [bioreactor metagenome]|jgi:large conductance mechanosensitive channel|uniref:Large-conductance mechanosensitive channel protein MscL n=2 Tax=root TaxID=1 RepID=A0AAN0MHI7_9ACTN|nr:large conductance mechanosensitive channel protein MscL [Brooklawnia sp. SH051]NLI84807.1 large conductance mechanosensitive channel protein MscL [Propionibacterium sp.]BEH02411.1 large-conductance mechanosensitive channel protein MscL [Brooklawnia sp. SH051]
MQGFKDFIMRGNLIELAVAFIMGAAFNSVVQSFTNIVLSLISLVLGGPPNFDDWQPGGIPFGPFVTQLVGFVLVAAVVYFALVLPVNKLREHMDTTKEEEASAATEAELLTEIRDLLASNKV